LYLQESQHSVILSFTRPASKETGMKSSSCLQHLDHLEAQDAQGLFEAYIFIACTMEHGQSITSSMEQPLLNINVLNFLLSPELTIVEKYSSKLFEHNDIHHNLHGNHHFGYIDSLLGHGSKNSLTYSRYFHHTVWFTRNKYVSLFMTGKTENKRKYGNLLRWFLKPVSDYYVRTYDESDNVICTLYIAH
jgi:hypothetical protein